MRSHALPLGPSLNKSLTIIQARPLLPLPALAQEEGAKAAKAREAMAAKLQQLEKQKGEVERTRDELKVGL